MKEDHWYHVESVFNIEEHSSWVSWYEGKAQIKNLIVHPTYNPHVVVDYINGIELFHHLESRELAEEILQYIKDTEILFI